MPGVWRPVPICTSRLTRTLCSELHCAQFSSSSFLEGPRWTATELSLVKELVRREKSDWEIASLFLHRSSSSVGHKADSARRDLGIHRPRRKWSEEDLSALRESRAKGMTVASVASLFPNRSWSAVFSKIRMLHRQTERENKSRTHVPLSDQEIADILRLRDQEHMIYAEIARSLQRSNVQVRAAYVDNRVWSAPTDERTHWFQQDKQEANRLADAGVSTKDIASTLKRSYSSVKRILTAAFQDGERKTHHQRPWLSEEAEKAGQMKHSGATIEEIAEELKRSPTTIRNHLKRQATSSANLDVPSK